MRKILGLVTAASIALSSVLTYSAAAPTAYAASTGNDRYVSASAKTNYSGNNVGKNVYALTGWNSWTGWEARNWAHIIYSNLSKTQDGYMRVQGDASDGKVLVEYFDDDFKFKSEKLIDRGLPLFGGFYETEDNYYILSGQENKGESDSVEVYRLTKYDKDWNALGKASLYGENTYIPFDAGSARFAHNGKYLVVRTCHEMYANKNDGLHHQANVTFEVDTDTMTVTDKLTKVAWDEVGYVSHSFNQFVQLDGNNIVGVDHGDAYPRSVALMKYTTDYTTGSFYYMYGCANVVEMLPISGVEGDNYTGVQVGGFEISGTSYIVAGTTVDQQNVDASSPNIFVSTVNRDLSGDVVITQLTDYDTASAPTNPHLVKINDNKFVLLWTRKNDSGTTYYTFLDGKGQRIGDIMTAPASLSDCKPIIADGLLAWYTWEGTSVVLHTIAVIDPPAKVTGLAAAERTADSITLTWGANAEADGYIVERNIGGKWTNVAKIEGVSNTTCKVSGLEQGTEYTFRVYAYKGSVMGEIADGTAVSTKIDTVIGGLRYTERDDGTLEVSCPEENKDALENASVRSEVNGKKVTSVGDLSGCENLESVAIPKSIESIDKNAFDNCPKLQNVYYAGSEEQFEDIGGKDVEGFKDADIEYNSMGPEIDVDIEIKNKKDDVSTANLTATITQNGAEIAVSQIGEDGKLNIMALTEGTYTITFAADNCAPRDYEVTLDGGELSGLDSGVELHLFGDINGDGELNTQDVARANAHVKGTSTLKGYELACINVNSDNNINVQDVALMNAHAKNTKKLW